MRRFHRRWGSSDLAWALHAQEVDLLQTLLRSLLDVLAQPEPGDPIHDRLFPSAVSDDLDADAALRAEMFDDLMLARRGGLEALDELISSGKERGDHTVVRLDDDGQRLVAGVLNDLRLALGARITIELIDRESLTEDDPRLETLALMDYLAHIQGELVDHLLNGTVGPDDPAE